MLQAKGTMDLRTGEEGTAPLSTERNPIWPLACEDTDRRRGGCGRGRPWGVVALLPTVCLAAVWTCLPGPQPPHLNREGAGP